MSDSNKYTVGWISAIPTEAVAAQQFIDERHENPLSVAQSDNNVYALGRVGPHNVVMASLPKGEYGTTSAATVASDMLHSFPNLRIGLMVGIAGGAPSAKHDIRLGDIVVSTPDQNTGGVFQYDFGKTIQDQAFHYTRILNQPPQVLRNAVGSLEVRYEADGHQLHTKIDQIIEDKPRLRKKYSRPPPASDKLYLSDIVHPENQTADCSEICGDDVTCLVVRTDRGKDDDDPAIHYGVIASGNQLMKDARIRDSLAAEKGVLCFEMEAAGLMNHFPCLVIRGICDYSDSHKNKQWQGFAAMTASAYARDLLLQIPQTKLEAEKPISRLVESLTSTMKDLRTSTEGVSQSLRESGLKSTLALFPVAHDAAFDSHAEEHNRYCLEGTRVELLKEIESWIRNPNAQTLFWLNGMAGTGKSTISRTIAQTASKGGFLGASFFFKRGEADRSGVSKLFSTLARQLCESEPAVIPQVKTAIDSEPSIFRKPMKEQIEKLIFEPLSSSSAESHENRNILIVIDALDECDREDDIKRLIHLLSKSRSIQSPRLKIFLTSRPDLPIRLGFVSIKGHFQDLILHEVPAPVIESDIRAFLENELTRVREEYNSGVEEDRRILATWPNESQLYDLVLMAAPLFIFAATVSRFLGDRSVGNPKEKLQRVLAQKVRSQGSRLAATYLPVLEQLLIGLPEPDQEERLGRFQNVVGSIIILADPLSASVLAKLLSTTSDYIFDSLHLLHSALSIPPSLDQPIRLLHLSFRDFLLDPDNSGNERFRIHGQQAHSRLAAECLRIMGGSLRTNICGLESYGTMLAEIDPRRIQEHLPSEVQYACRYWIYHLRQSHATISDNGEVHKFLKKHFLHWLEALGLMQQASESIRSLAEIRKLPLDGDRELVAFFHDAERFLLGTVAILRLAPLQIYASGLLFAPTRSVVRSLFQDEVPRWLFGNSVTQAAWNSCRQTIDCYPVSVIGLAFSPDGRAIASVSYHSQISIWDAATGELQQTWEFERSKFKAVAFTSDNSVVVVICRSGAGVVMRFDVGTGQETDELPREIRGLTDDCAVAFSSDGRVVVFVSADHAVELWDIATLEILHTLKLPDEMVLSVALSYNEQVVALGHDDGTVTLRDLATGALRCRLFGHGLNVLCLDFAPDGRCLASGSREGFVELWDPVTCKLQRILGLDNEGVYGVAFSPDSQVVGSASDFSIKLWDVDTGKPQLEALETHTHTGMVSVLALSPDGRVMASGSADQTVKLWDAATHSLLRTLGGLTETVTAMAFSSDGRVLASASHGGTVKLWDTTAYELQSALDGHMDRVIAVAFSPDGRVLASASRDCTVKLWDATAHKLRSTLEGHNDWVTAVVFSPDGLVVASAAHDWTIKLWDATTHELRHTLQGQDHWIRAQGFSPDGLVLASVCTGDTITLWNTATGEMQRELDLGGASYSLSFSPGGLLLLTEAGAVSMSGFQGQSPTATAEHVPVLGYGLTEESDWVTFDGKKQLWLPHEYRPTSGYHQRVSIVRGSSLVFGCPDGKVWFLDCSEDGP